MKKALFHGLAACLFLAILSCGVDEQNDGQGGYVTLNGPEASGSRALDGPIAEALTNFYEATFQRLSDGKILRATWNYAQRGRTYIEPGDYKVILLAGRNGIDKTLLGVGQATGIGGGGSISTNPNTPLNVTITAATTDLYFHAYPLMNNINGVADSSFETPLTTYPFPPTQYEEDDFGNNIPVFKITRDTETTAEWRFGLGALPGTVCVPSVPSMEGQHGDPGTGDQISIFGPYIRVARTPAPPSYTPFLTIPPFTSLISASFTDLTTGTQLTGTFTMSFTAPNQAGLVQISLEVPVVAIANTDKPVIWYIRGGLNNGTLDAGIDPDNKAGVIGGDILLGF